MQPIHYSLLLHFIGMGILFTALLGGWIINGLYGKAASYKEKIPILRVLRPIGLLSPIGVIILLLSGIWNIILTGYDLFSESWLGVKMLFFAVMVIAGVFVGAKSARRSKLVSQATESADPPNRDNRIASMDKQQGVFYIFQTVLLLIIIILSVVKPY